MPTKLFAFLITLLTTHCCFAADAILHNIPYSNRADTPYVRITNTSNEAASIRGTYYTQEGNILGVENSLLTANLAPNQTFIVNSFDIEQLVGAKNLPERGRGRLAITSDQDNLVVMSLIRTSEQILTNTSEVSTDGLLLSVPSSASSDEFYIRVTNVNDTPIRVTGTLTSDDASVIGNPNSVLIESVAPGATSVISKFALEDQIADSQWSGFAKLTLAPKDDIVVMGMNRSSNVLVNTSATNDSNWIDYLPSGMTGEVFTLRILNSGNDAIRLYGRLYSENGTELASAELSQSLGADQVLTLTEDSLKEALGLDQGWVGIAKLKLESNSSLFKWHNLIRAGGTLTNLSSQSESFAVHNIPASNNYADTSFVNVSNHTGETIALSGTLYHQEGEIIGQASASFGTLAPFATHSLSATDLEHYLNVGAWTGRARLVLDELPLKSVSIHGIVKKDGVVTNLSQPVQSQLAGPFALTSSSFDEGADIPLKFACQYEPGGQNISPQLSWSPLPEDVQSFAIIMDDPTADNWIHWNLWNIPADVKSLDEDTTVGTRGRNDLPGTGYFGPCPASRHKYVFTVYALNEQFSSSSALTREEFERRHEHRIITSATLTGRYSPR
ncbi:YbhB/YbcL family Raf kinase inhibitor-like protein [Alteromonas sp. S015]|uniref:YbhB/YbcL family Raf kinase inhibitor-like protein n=1 Tax=Alteromonas sp. S015 TaxID=3117401 RepID=UPI002FE0939B